MKTSQSKKALQISLLVSVLSLAAKSVGFYVTASTMALSDAVESVIHILAVSFVYYGFLLSSKPPDEKHLYGHERIEFLSVGIEGAVIILAGITIIYQSLDHYLHGHQLNNLDLGMIMLSIAAVINYALGKYLIRIGNHEHNMMVVSNGKHTLTDVWTTLGVIATLIIIRFTGWILLDSMAGFFLAIYIMYEGFKLLRYSVDGIMDSKNPEVHKAILRILEHELPGDMINYHNLRHRTTGSTSWIEFHVIFKKDVSLKKAHDDATILEKELINAIRGDVIVTIHLEPEGTHEEVHRTLKDANQNRPLKDFI